GAGRGGRRLGARERELGAEPGRQRPQAQVRLHALTMNGRPRVVVLGGGFAGLESAFYLRARLGERAAITLVSDQDDFLFKPNTIYVPFGADPSSLLIPLARPAAKRDI